MIQIVVKREPPEKRRLVMKCNNCESVIAADREDIKSENPFYSFTCPVCEKVFQTPIGAGMDFFINTYFRLVSNDDIEDVWIGKLNARDIL